MRFYILVNPYTSVKGEGFGNNVWIFMLSTWRLGHHPTYYSPLPSSVPQYGTAYNVYERILSLANKDSQSLIKRLSSRYIQQIPIMNEWFTNSIIL